VSVSIRFYANVKKQVGDSEIELNLDPSREYSIKDVLREIGLLGGAEGEDGTRKKHRVLINGRMIHSLDESEVLIKDGDSIAVFPLLAGG
jgi:molybdopterin converting factor small subunit